MLYAAHVWKRNQDNLAELPVLPLEQWHWDIPLKASQESREGEGLDE